MSSAALVLSRHIIITKDSPRSLVQLLFCHICHIITKDNPRSLVQLLCSSCFVTCHIIITIGSPRSRPPRPKWLLSSHDTSTAMAPSARTVFLILSGFVFHLSGGTHFVTCTTQPTCTAMETSACTVFLIRTGFVCLVGPLSSHDTPHKHWQSMV